MNNLLNGLPETVLTTEQENDLARIIQKGNDDSVTTLVLHNMREAFPYVTTCCRGKLQPDEIFSLCYAALCKAARNFKPGGIRFFAYAKVYLRGEISRTWKNTDVVRDSSLHETEPLPDIVHRNLIDGDQEQEEEIVEMFKKRLGPDHVDPEYDAIHLRERWAMVAPLMESKLNERERMILQLYYESGFSFEEIGNMLVPSVSRSAVQAKHKQALGKLKLSLSRKGYTV